MRAPSSVYRLVFMLGVLAMIGVATWYGAVLPKDLSLKEQLQAIKQLPQLWRKEVTTPPPLRGPRDETRGVLTIEGVLRETNRHREAAGLPPLTGSSVLGQAAHNKLTDMFAQQYFDHVSPQGVKPADVVDEVGYDYLRVGENLALGNFGSDAALVQAWMDSPGHRENILSPRFTELGIAVGDGTFKNHQTWLAVQTFALPASACPAPNASLQQDFQAREAAAKSLSASLATQYQALTTLTETFTAQRQAIEQKLAQAREKIKAGNEEIARGNEIYQETGSEEQARPHWERGEALQQEGQALQTEAEALRQTYNEQVAAAEQQQREYNTQVEILRQQEEELKELVRTVNQQISAFNTCLKR